MEGDLEDASILVFKKKLEKKLSRVSLTFQIFCDRIIKSNGGCEWLDAFALFLCKSMCYQRKEICFAYD